MPPVAVSGCEYRLPTIGDGSDIVVMLSEAPDAVSGRALTARRATVNSWLRKPPRQPCPLAPPGFGLVSMIRSDPRFPGRGDEFRFADAAKQRRLMLVKIFLICRLL